MTGEVVHNRLPPLIRDFEYDVEKQELTLRFTSSYTYEKVPPALAMAFAKAYEANRYSTAFFDANIEGKFRSRHAP